MMTFSLMKCICSCSISHFLVPNTTEPDYKSKDWVFLNYTYKRFEGLTQRGSIPTYMKAGKLWRKITLAQKQENSGSCITSLLGRRWRHAEYFRGWGCLWPPEGILGRVSQTTTWIGWQCQLAFFFDIVLFLLTLLYEGTGIKGTHIPF